MRKTLIILSAFILTLTTVVAVVMTDGYRVYRFRTTQDHLPEKIVVNTTGLRELNLSGSNKIVFRDLYRKLENQNQTKYFVNVSESQVPYIGDFAADFFGYGLDSPDFKHYMRRLIITGKLKIDNSRLVKDSDVAKRYGFTYIFLPQEKQGFSRPACVDQFVATIESLPTNAWIHVFSESGRGRTSLAMVMIDIMRNCTYVPLDDIIKRQHLLGSEDLFDTTVWRQGTYKAEQLEQRKNFIKQFYAYMRERSQGKKVLWQEWIKSASSD